MIHHPHRPRQQQVYDLLKQHGSLGTHRICELLLGVQVADRRQRKMIYNALARLQSRNAAQQIEPGVWVCLTLGEQPCQSFVKEADALHEQSHWKRAVYNDQQRRRQLGAWQQRC